MVYVLVNFCKARILKFSSNDVCVLTVYFHPKHAGVDVAMRVLYKSGFKSNGPPALPPVHPCLSTLHNFIYPFCQPEFVGSREHIYWHATTIEIVNCVRQGPCSQRIRSRLVQVGEGTFGSWFPFTGKCHWYAYLHIRHPFVSFCLTHCPHYC